MSAKILTISDFEKGTYKIPLNNYSTADFQYFLDNNESKILNDILSSPLTDELLDDISGGVPQSDRFKTLFSLDLKEILIIVTYYRFLTTKGNITLTHAGFINSKADAANVLTPYAATRNIISLYNNGLFIPINKVDHLQNYILDNREIYPEFTIFTNDYFIKTAKKFKVSYII